MEQLIAKDEDDYIKKVVHLMNNTDEYVNIRKSVFLNAINSPLFNKKRFAENFFNSLREIIK